MMLVLSFAESWRFSPDKGLLAHSETRLIQRRVAMKNVSVPSQKSCALRNSNLLRESLKQETQQQHRALENTLDLLRPDFTLFDYGTLLTKFYSFHVVFDNIMQRHKKNNVIPAEFYCVDRMKHEWLLEDLSALAITPAPTSGSAAECLASELTSAEHLWGAIYVIEGSTLGGTLLSKHFEKKFGINTDTGLHFFTGYGQHTGKNWQLTVDRLRDCETQKMSSEAIVHGAKRTFQLLEAHLQNAIKETVNT